MKGKTKMKRILNEKGSLIARCIVFQIAMSIFGIMINFATVQLGNTILILGAVFSVLFYFALVGASLNEDGLKDKIKYDRNKEKADIFYGLKYVAVSYIPSFVITAVFSLFRTLNIFESFTYVVNMLIRFFISGMYIGVDILLFSGTDSVGNTVYDYFSLNGYSFLIYQIVSIIICGLFYYLGIRGINLVGGKKKDN